MLAVALASPAGACACCTRSTPDPAARSSSRVLVGANLGATVLRFLLLRHWVFRPPHPPAPPRPPPGASRVARACSTRPDRRPPSAATAPPARRRAPALRAAGRRDPAWVRPALLALLGRDRAALPVGARPRPAGPTRSTPPPSRPARRAGRRCSSAPPTPPNSITVDKPPAAAVGDGAVGAALRAVARGRCSCRRRWRASPRSGCCTLTVRRVSTPGRRAARRRRAGPTPVAALMFRFNNPDALLVLLLVALGVRRRARPRARRHPLAARSPAPASASASSPSMLQAFLVLPALAAVYLYAAPASLRRRVLQLLAAGAAHGRRRRLVAGRGRADAGGARPYIGGSQSNSILDLTPGLQRPRPAHRRRDRQRRRRRRPPVAAGARPVCCGCSAPSSAARRRG